MLATMDGLLEYAQQHVSATSTEDNVHIWAALFFALRTGQLDLARELACQTEVTILALADAMHTVCSDMLA